MNYNKKINRISEITDFYLNRFGRTQIGIFQLPTADPDSPWFYIFTNTLMVTMRRKDIMPYNFWVRDENANRFILIVWGSGYFRSDLHDIAPIVNRIWSLHSHEPTGILGSFSLSVESVAEKACFYQTAANLLSSVNVTGSNWHQRTFGGSVLR